MRREGYGTWFVSVFVRSSVTTTTRNETTKLRHQQLHWPHCKKGDFDVTSAFKSYGVKGR